MCRSITRRYSFKIHLAKFQQEHIGERQTRPRKLRGPWTTTCRFFFGGDDPKREHFRKYLSGFIDETPYYVWWPNLVKIGRCEVTERSYGLGLPHIKTRAPRDSSQPPFCSKWANRAQNTHNFISPRRVAETKE